MRFLLLAAAALMALTACGDDGDSDRAERRRERARERERAERVEHPEPGPTGAMLTDANRIRARAFVLGALEFTMTHELGHLVLAEYGIPNPGGSEIAADRFATLVLTPAALDVVPEYESFDPAAGADAPGILWASAFFRNLHQKVEKANAIDWADEHGAPEQRVRQIMCLLYGADPPRWSRQNAFTEALTEPQRERCIRDAADNRAAWRNILGDKFASDSTESYRAVVTYEDAPADLQDARAWAMDNRVLEDVAAKLGELRAPDSRRPTALGGWDSDPDAWRRIQVVGSACSDGQSYDVNAFWLPEQRAIVLCYALVTAFQDFADETLAALPPERQAKPYE